MNKEKIYEILRFGIVGIIATAIHYGIYYILIKCFELNCDIWTSMAYSIGYIVSFVINYFLSAKFTFKENATIKNGIGFVLSHAVNYVLHVSILNLLLKIGIPDVYAPVPVYMIVVPINFVLVRFVFKKIK